MSVLIEARAATMRYPARDAPAVDHVDLDIREGAAIGIVGESGSGKTTLARLLVGAVRATSGSVTVAGTDWRTVKRRDPLRRDVQMIFQDPYGALNPWHTPLQTVSEVIRVWRDVGTREARRSARELLREVGLSEDAMSRRPGRLSGGQCQRVGIARALACRPRVLIADEPTSALDVSVQAQILNLLLALRESRNLALVLISHDLGVVQYATDEAFVMYAGRVVEHGSTDAIFSHPLHPYTRILVDSIPGQPGPVRPASNAFTGTGCVFAQHCPFSQDDCHRHEPALRDVFGRGVACLHPLGSKSGGFRAERMKAYRDE